MGVGVLWWSTGSEEGYHYYYIDPTSFDDHVELVAGQALEVVSVEGRCVLGRQLLRRENYCLEYGVDGSNIRPIVLVCPDTWKGMDVHTEKFGLTAVLLGFSCAALFATAFSLISTRVRRGLVTVKKVNTLAGRILLSYVLAYLVAFLLLAVNMKVEVSQDNIECQTMGESSFPHLIFHDTSRLLRSSIHQMTTRAGV
nr:uncharacterized protein LOC128684402 [Cherax quadricarinatus]